MHGEQYKDLGGGGETRGVSAGRGGGCDMFYCWLGRISCFKNCYITYTSRTIIFLLMPYGSTDNRQSSC